MSGSVTFEKSVDDLLGTYRDWFWANIRRHPAKRLIRLAVIVAALVFAGWQLNLREVGTGDVLHGAAVGMMVVLPICWTISYALLPHRVRRLYLQQRTADHEWTWSWTEEGLASRSANGHNHYAWHEFHSWLPGRHAILFFLNDNHVLYIARRVLKEGEAADLTRIAQRAGISRF